MGNKKFNLTKLALAVGVTVGLAGCFSDNDNNVDIKPKPVDPTPTVTVETPPTAVEKQAGSIGVLVTNHLGATLDSSVTATIAFKDETGLLTTAGAEIAAENKSTTGSSFAFTVAEVSEAGTTYTFTVDAEGFLSGNGELTINSETPNPVAEVRLTPESLTDSEIPVVAETKALSELATEGVEVEYSADNGLVIGNGADPEAKLELTQAIPDSQSKTAVGSVKVAIKQGTKFVDENDQPLEETPVLTVAYFANEATRVDSETADNDAAESVTRDSSLDAFPGGLNLSLAPTTDGAEAEVGSFTSGGFVAIELKAGDQDVKSFGTDADGNPIKLEVAMQVDRKTANPCPVTYTGDISEIEAFAEANGFAKGVCTLTDVASREVTPNDIFPVWSYEESTGEWSFESYGRVSDNEATPATYDVQVEVAHLSYWNLDFFTRAIQSPKCPDRRVDFNIEDADGNPSSLVGDLIIEANGYRDTIRGWEWVSRDKGTFFSPPAFPVALRFSVNGQNVTAGLKGSTDENFAIIGDGTQSRVLTFSNMCDQLDGQTLVLTATPPELVEQPVSTNFTCAANADVDVAAAPVPTAAKVQIFRDNRLVVDEYSAGTFNASLESGVAYTVRAQNPKTAEWTTPVAIESASTTAVTINFEETCGTTTQPVTGTGSGS